MNLVVNASEALEDREGLVRAATSRLHVQRGIQTNFVPDLREGTYALIEVTDTGRGMTEQEQSRIFDPFYTTK